jgi:calcium uniporter protein, mitochondrial
MGVGDFILHEARGKGFAVEIKALKKESRVEVPSFNDRTHHLRARLRKTRKEPEAMASIKKECDDIAQRVVVGGFG